MHKQGFLFRNGDNLQVDFRNPPDCSGYKQPDSPGSNGHRPEPQDSPPPGVVLRQTGPSTLHHLPKRSAQTAKLLKAQQLRSEPDVPL